MGSLSLKVRYRPIRFGLCIRSGDIAALSYAQRLSMTMWGGYFNPIIPVDDTDLAEALIKLFRVDVLWPVTSDSTIEQFISAHAYLRNPFHQNSLFVGRPPDDLKPYYVDIFHPITRLYEEHYKKNTMPNARITVLNWRPDDPLSNLILSAYGGFPSPVTTGFDYEEFVKANLSPTIVSLGQSDPLPDTNKSSFHLSSYSRLFIDEHYSIRNNWRHSGLYIGSVTNFADLLNFWNVRATGTPLQFYDPVFAARLDQRRDTWLEILRQRPPGTLPSDSSIGLWHRQDAPIADPSIYGANIMDVGIDSAIWNGLNIRASLVYFSEHSVLAATDKISTGKQRISFQLPSKPLSEARSTYNQHYVVSIGMGIGLFGEERQTLMTPYLPALNEYYGRNLYFEYDKARVEPESFGIICDVNRSDLSLDSLDVGELISRIFKSFNIDAEPSKAGLVASQLVRQMGGLGGCRPFKITGVRKLIEKYKPDQAFSRGNATNIIHDRDTTGNASFDRHEYLHIERRDRGSLTTSQVFDYMLKRGVFRAGLKFDCPSCKLDFWTSIDDVRSNATCEYCGEEFNITPHLKDGGWGFRRSGLFGKDNNQEGAIPVTLTLMQLNTIFHGKMIYTTGMNLTHVPSGKKCETDFVAVIDSHPGETEIVISECKTRQEITQDDVDNLRLIADTLKAQNLTPFIILSKLVPFTADEIARIRTLNTQYERRVIMFTERELEPYLPYERTEKELNIKVRGSSLADMADATVQIYFTP